jgi:probable metal-binding protein
MTAELAVASFAILPDQQEPRRAARHKDQLPSRYHLVHRWGHPPLIFSMENQTHGHDVLDFMIASGATYTRTSLADAIRANFGPGTLYHTCSADSMTAEQLIEFLASRGKFQGSEAGFTVATDRVCQH